MINKGDSLSSEQKYEITNFLTTIKAKLESIKKKNKAFEKFNIELLSWNNLETKSSRTL